MGGVEATLRRMVGAAVREAASDKGVVLSGLPEIIFEKPKRDGQGDLSTNCAMQLSRLLGEKPAELAKKIAAKLSDDPYLDRVETAGPGFINFFLSPRWMGEVLGEILAEGGMWGSSDLGGGKKVQESCQRKPTGPLHGGRGAAVGYYRQYSCLTAEGWGVLHKRRGLQMDLLASVQAQYFRKLVKATLRTGGAVYFRGGAIGSGGEFLSMPAGESLPFFKTFSAGAILDSIKKDLADFGVRFDVWFSEKTLYERDLVSSAMETLKERGYAFGHEGALWFKSSDFTDEKDRVLIRGNGAPTYFASDIAYHRTNSTGASTGLSTYGGVSITHMCRG